MPKTGLKCPKCGTVMGKSPNAGYLDPFEIGYHCPKCDAHYSFDNWQNYYETCAYEEKEKEKNKPRPFNPSVRGSVMKSESKT